MDSMVEPLTAFVTWALTMGLRRWFPDAWESLGDRRIRIGAVALVATVASIVAGIQQGLDWFGVGKLALSALAGSVLIRQTTKQNELRYGELDLTRATSLRTKPPQPHYD
jgi:hypothetical protein